LLSRTGSSRPQAGRARAHIDSDRCSQIRFLNLCNTNCVNDTTWHRHSQPHLNCSRWVQVPVSKISVMMPAVKSPT